MEENEFKTSCRDCVFAVYNQHGVQTDCSSGFLEKYQNAKAEIKIVSDEEKSFYNIINRLCIACRLKESKWAKENEGNYLQVIKEDIKFRYDIVVPLNKSNIKDVMKTTQSILNLSNKPRKVIYVFKELNMSYGELLRHVTFSYVGTGINWQIKKIEEETLSFEHSIGLCIENSVSEYIFVFIAGQEAVPTLINKVEYELREKMSQFVMVLPDENDNGLVISRKAYLACGGNNEIEIKQDDEEKRISNFIDKLIVLTKMEGKQNFIWTHQFQPLQ